jgi:hypothetical protein
LTGGHAFAIELTDQDKFTLLHLSKGKPTISRGTFAVAGKQLTLSSSDTSNVVSEFTFTEADRFQMKIGTAVLSFNRAK